MSTTEYLSAIVTSTSELFASLISTGPDHSIIRSSCCTSSSLSWGEAPARGSSSASAVAVRLRGYVNSTESAVLCDVSLMETGVTSCKYSPVRGVYGGGGGGHDSVGKTSGAGN